MLMRALKNQPAIFRISNHRRQACVPKHAQKTRTSHLQNSNSRRPACVAMHLNRSRTFHFSFFGLPEASLRGDACSKKSRTFHVSFFEPSKVSLRGHAYLKKNRSSQLSRNSTLIMFVIFPDVLFGRYCFIKVVQGFAGSKSDLGFETTFLRFSKTTFLSPIGSRKKTGSCPAHHLKRNCGADLFVRARIPGGAIRSRNLFLRTREMNSVKLWARSNTARCVL